MTPSIEQIAAQLQGYDPQSLRADAVLQFLAQLVEPVTATERKYRITGDDLVMDMSMAAMGHPLTHHLHATLRRST